MKTHREAKVPAHDHILRLELLGLACVCGITAAAAPGDIKWRFPAACVGGCPAVDDRGTIYLPAIENSVYAINSQDGTKVWESAIEGSFASWSPILCPEGILVVGLDEWTVGSLHATFYGLDIVSGQSRWNFNDGTKLDCEFPYASVGPGGNLFVGGRDESSGYVVGTKSGDLRRQFAPFPCVRPVSLSLDGMAYSMGNSSSQALVAFSLIDNRPVWTWRDPGYLSPWLGDSQLLNWGIWGLSFGHNNLLYAGLSSTVRCFDSQTGSLVWSCPTGSEGAPAPVGGAPTVGSDDIIYFGCYVGRGSYGGRVTAVDGFTGEVKWTCILNEPVNATGTLTSDGLIWFCTTRGRVVGLATADGTIRYDIELHDEIWTATFPGLTPDGTVLIATQNALYAIQGTAGLDTNAPWPKFQCNQANTGLQRAERPHFKLEPHNRVLTTGRATALPSQVIATPRAAVQWFKDTVPLAGATNETLELSEVTSDTAGTYFLVATNVAGTIVSSNITILVTSTEALSLPGLLLSGPSGTSVIVQASAKLGREAQWNDWNRIGLADQPTVIIDPQAVDTTTRFFRLASNGAIAIQRYNGIRLEGTPGSRYQVDFVDTGVTWANWTALATVTLTNTFQLYIDERADRARWRRYRASPIQ